MKTLRRLRSSVLESMPPELRRELRRLRGRFQLAESRFRRVLPEQLGGRFRSAAVHCRRLADADVDALQSLRRAPGGDNDSKSSERVQIVSPRGFWMGAFVRGRLIGAGYCQGAFTAGDRPFEHALYLSDFVLRAWRRRGIAQHLHAARLRELHTLGCTRAFAWVNPENHASAAALLAVGFECLPESEVPAWLPRPSIKHLLLAKSMAG